jgi:hypothetical protein
MTVLYTLARDFRVRRKPLVSDEKYGEIVVQGVFQRLSETPRGVRCAARLRDRTEVAP